MAPFCEAEQKQQQQQQKNKKKTVEHITNFMQKNLRQAFAKKENVSFFIQKSQWRTNV